MKHVHQTISLRLNIAQIACLTVLLLVGDWGLISSQPAFAQSDKPVSLPKLCRVAYTEFGLASEAQVLMPNTEDSYEAHWEEWSLLSQGGSNHCILHGSSHTAPFQCTSIQDTGVVDIMAGEHRTYHTSASSSAVGQPYAAHTITADVTPADPATYLLRGEFTDSMNWSTAACPPDIRAANRCDYYAQGTRNFGGDYGLGLTAGTDGELVVRYEIGAPVPPQNTFKAPTLFLNSPDPISLSGSGVYTLPLTTGDTPYLTFVGMDGGPWQQSTYSFSAEHQSHISWEMNCPSPGDLRVEVSSDGKILCNEEGRFILKLKINVIHEGTPVQNAVVENLGMSIEASASNLAQPIKNEEILPTFSANTTQSLTRDLDLTDYLQLTDGLLPPLTVKVTLDDNHQIDETAEDNNTAELNPLEPTLDNPGQYIPQEFPLGSGLDNQAWLGEENKQIRARFGPMCKIPGQDFGSRLPLRTLAKALSPALDHFNWLQTVAFPSTIKVYRIEGCDYCGQGQDGLMDIDTPDHKHIIDAIHFGTNIYMTCTRTNHDRTRFAYLQSPSAHLPVTVTAVTGPIYDPLPVLSIPPIQTYAFKSDGYQLGDVCWQTWGNPGPDAAETYFADEGTPSYIGFTIDNAMSSWPPLSSQIFYVLNYEDVPVQLPFMLTWGDRSETNQYLHFRTLLVGVDDHEYPLMKFNGFSWKSNTVVKDFSALAGGISPDGMTKSLPLDQLVGGIFDVRPLHNDDLVVTPDTLAISATVGGPTNQYSLTLTTLDGSSKDWTLQTTDNWITLAATSGATPQSVEIGVNPTNLPSGIYTSSIKITAGSETALFPVTLALNPSGAQAVLAVSPQTLNFSAVQGGNNPSTQTISIENKGGGSMNWSASESLPWLSLSTVSGTAPSTVTVAVANTGLPAGQQTGAIEVTAGGQQKTIEVTLVVAPSGTEEQRIFLPLVRR